MPDRMLAEKAGSIGWMIFDHPERRNAVTQAMWLQIGEILEDFVKDEAIRVVVLKGAGDKAFVSGTDPGTGGKAPAASGVPRLAVSSTGLSHTAPPVRRIRRALRRRR
jgi:enoyl-CoA hydratase/carnithine racemase